MTVSEFREAALDCRTGHRWSTGTALSDPRTSRGDGPIVQLIAATTTVRPSRSPRATSFGRRE